MKHARHFRHLIRNRPSPAQLAGNAENTQAVGELLHPEK